jgi:alkanesulfonate monooxygenase SsuD/methylene tetrahydromethanopterin reductase-like flavin-dependent oxidoreductase (luciferase family)
MEFAVQARGDWARLRDVASWAGARGLGAMALPDHYLQRGDDLSKPAWDHLVHLAALAVVSDLELVSLVSPVTFRHPGVLYKMAVTIDEISGGRFTLGVGTGWMEEEFDVFGLPYPDMGERMDRLEEAMAYLRAAISPGPHGFEGRHYRLAEFDPQPTPANLRLAMGGAGRKRSRAIAARYADEYNLYACVPARYLAVREKTADELVALGRGPDDIFWTSAGPALAAKKESDYRRLLDELAGLTGQSTERIEQVYEERQYPHGSGAKAAEMIAALEESGCRRYYLQIFNTPLPNFDVILEAYQG